MAYYIIKDFKHNLMQFNEVKEVNIQKASQIEVKGKKEMTKQEERLQTSKSENCEWHGLKPEKMRQGKKHVKKKQ